MLALEGLSRHPHLSPSHMPSVTHAHVARTHCMYAACTVWALPLRCLCAALMLPVRCCKTREIFNSWKNDKIVISVKNPKFILYILDDETDLTVRIVSQNLAITSNFVEFRDRQNLHAFRGIEFRVPKNDLWCDKSHI